MRAFIALDLPDDTVTALERLQAALPVGRLVPGEDMHLTLGFLGDRVSLPQLDEIHEGLDALPWPQLSLTPRGLDLFKPEQPTSLHVRIVADPALSALHRRVEAIARGAGLALPRRRFVPHVTLARFPATLAADQVARIGRFLQAHGAFAAPPFAPPALSLYRSHLGGEAPHYECLARYGPLAAFLD
jgi:2'-5' RNA ligase